DPRKGEDWYAEQRQRFDPVTAAQEVDIDYSASVEGVCIPAAWVRAAVGLDLTPGGQTVAGLDIAEEGRDLSVLIARRGPVVADPISWGQCNTTETAWRARDEGAALRVALLNYDSNGVGAGVRGTWVTAERPLPFRANPVNAGDEPTATVWPDGRSSR